MRLINFDNLIATDYDTGKSSKTSLRIMLENSGSDESMILKRDNKLMLDMDSSKGLIGKSSKDSKDLGPIGERAYEEDAGFGEFDQQDGGFDEYAAAGEEH